MICNHLDALSMYVDLHSTTYEKIFILGDFKLSAITTILQALSNSPHVTKIQITLHALIWFYLTHLEASRVLVL